MHANLPPTSHSANMTAAEDSQYLAMVSKRAGEHIEYGFDLAARGALFSAETEFSQGLLLIAQALDAHHQTQAHTRAINAGLRALREADDFVPRNGQAVLRLDEIVASHKTPVWRDTVPENLPPLVAMQRYYTYAQQQFSIAGGRVPAAGMALYGLGRMQPTLAGDSSVKKMTAGPKAMALYQATLKVDPNNYLAANELGVLYGRYGQWAEAEIALRHSVELAPRAENWQNLAAVYDRMGNKSAGDHARQQEQIARKSSTRPGWTTTADRPPLNYVDVETFVKASGPPDSDELLTDSSSGSAAQTAAADSKGTKRAFGWFGKSSENVARTSNPTKTSQK